MQRGFIEMEERFTDRAVTSVTFSLWSINFNFVSITWLSCAHSHCTIHRQPQPCDWRVHWLFYYSLERRCSFLTSLSNSIRQWNSFHLLNQQFHRLNCYAQNSLLEEDKLCKTWEPKQILRKWHNPRRDTGGILPWPVEKKMQLNGAPASHWLDTD